MAKFNKDTVLADVLKTTPEAAPMFFEIGMHCLGCAMASEETLGEACQVHGVDADAFIAKLNERFGGISL